MAPLSSTVLRVPTSTPTAPPGAPVGAPALAAAAGYSVLLARDDRDVRDAQRLRHQVFATEMGAHLSSPDPALDVDFFDRFCDHLLVREEATGSVVGTHRLLPPRGAAQAGRLYSHGEFDLTMLDPIRRDLVEAGRSCVHPRHRDGGAIALMWAGIARYLTDRGHEWLGGCCSVPLSDGGTLAAGVQDTVDARYLSPPEYRVRPRTPWRHADVTRPERATLPPLLRGYLRLGAWVCGEPAHDPEFGVADFYVLLSLRRTDPRYLRRFLALTADR